MCSSGDTFGKMAYLLAFQYMYVCNHCHCITIEALYCDDTKGQNPRLSAIETTNILYCDHFFLSLSPTVLSELGLSSVDNLILSFPPCSEDDLTLARMQPVWREMEQLSTTGVARSIGVADLFKDQLKELYDWSTVKPTIDQVNLAHCCTIPEVRFIIMSLLCAPV